jgi:hypothetical protein
LVNEFRHQVEIILNEILLIANIPTGLNFSRLVSTESDIYNQLNYDYQQPPISKQYVDAINCQFEEYISKVKKVPMGEIPLASFVFDVTDMQDVGAAGVPSTPSPTGRDENVIVTDYLVIGAGASGMAFVDELHRLSPESKIDVVDREAVAGEN